jgi:hypothetical protein
VPWRNINNSQRKLTYSLPLLSKILQNISGKIFKSVGYDKTADVMTLADFWQKKEREPR